MYLGLGLSGLGEHQFQSVGREGLRLGARLVAAAARRRLSAAVAAAVAALSVLVRRRRTTAVLQRKKMLKRLSTRFDTDLLGVLLDYVGILRGFTVILWILPGFTGFKQVLLGYSGFY